MRLAYLLNVFLILNLFDLSVAEATDQGDISFTQKCHAICGEMKQYARPGEAPRPHCYAPVGYPEKWVYLDSIQNGTMNHFYGEQKRVGNLNNCGSSNGPYQVDDDNFSESDCDGDRTCKVTLQFCKKRDADVRAGKKTVDQCMKEAGYVAGGNGNTGTTTTTAATDSLSSIETQVLEAEEEYDEQCDKKQSYASECCQDPRQCLESRFKPDDEEAQNLSTALARSYFKFQDVAGGLTTQLTMMGNTKMCKAMKGLHLLGAATNSALVTMCNKTRNMCEDSCTATKSKARAALQSLSVGSVSSRSACNNLDGRSFTSATDADSIAQARVTAKNLCERAMEVSIDSEKKISHCGKGMSGNTMTLLAANALGATMAAKFQLCADDMGGTETGFEEPDEVAFNGDCTSVANMSNPICVACRRNPEAAACASLLLPETPGGNVVDTPTFNNDDLYDSDGSDYGGLGTFSADDIETAGPDFIAPNSDGGVDAAGGGGSAGFGGGGGGFGAASSGEGGNRAPSSAGYDTDILKGERGGSGYSVSGVPVGGGGGGFRGYASTGNDIDRDKRGNIFDKMRKAIKKAKDDTYGSKRNPASKTLLGMMEARRKRGIAGKHEDLFEIIHETHQAMCIEGVFFTCNDNYENFNYYKHMEFVRNTYLLELSICQKMKSCTPTDEQQYMNEVTSRETFLSRYYKGRFKKLFSQKSYRKGQRVKVVPRSCRVNDDGCNALHYKKFVYVGAPKGSMQARKPSKAKRRPASRRK